MGKKGKQRAATETGAGAGQASSEGASSQPVDGPDTGMAEGSTMQVDGIEHKKRKKNKKSKSKDSEDSFVASQLDNTATQSHGQSRALESTQLLEAVAAHPSSSSSSPDKKSKKRKRESEVAARAPQAEAIAQDIVEDGELALQAAAALAANANRSVVDEDQPNKKKKRKNKDKRNKVAFQGDVTVNEHDTETGNVTQGAEADADETMLTANGDGEADDADTTAAALEKQRRKEKKRLKKEEKRRKAEAKAEAQAEAARVSQSQPGPQPSGQTADTAGEDTRSDQQDELEAPPAAQTVVLPSTTKKEHKRTKKDKKGKGKEKQGSALPLFQPEDDAEPHALQDGEDIDEVAVPELPPPLSSAREAAAPANSSEEDDSDVIENDRSLLDPPNSARRSTRTANATKVKTASKIVPTEPAPSQSSRKRKAIEDQGESDEEDASPALVTPAKKRGRPSKAAQAEAAPAESSTKKKRAPASAAEKAASAKKAAAQNKGKGKEKEVVSRLPPSQNSRGHREILSTKWLDTKALNELKEDGLFYKTGKFSADEDDVLRETVTEYQADAGLSNAQLMGIMFGQGGKSRKENGPFWQALAEACIDRPITSVFHHVRRMYQPDARGGAWTPEQDKALMGSVKQFGEKWEQVAERVGRWSADCRDRYRNHLGSTDSKQKKKIGAWTTAEENKLRKSINQVKEEKGVHFGSQAADASAAFMDPNTDNEVFWTAVAAKFGGTRTRAQCRIKWQDNMNNKIVDNKGRKLRWGRRDTYLLIQKLDNEKAPSQSEINWQSFIDPGEWDWWSPHVLTKRFATMRGRALKALGKEDAGYPEILQWLVAEQEGIPKNQVIAFLAAGPQREGSNDANDAEQSSDEDAEEVEEDVDVDVDELESDEEEEEIVVPAKKDKGKGRASEPGAGSSKAKTSATPAKGKAKKAAPASAPAKVGKSSSKRSSKAGPSVTRKTPRTKEFISDSDEEAADEE